MKKVIFLFLLLTQTSFSQVLEVTNRTEYVVSQLLIDAGKGGIGLGAIVKTVYDTDKYDIEVVQIDGPDIIVRGVSLGPLKMIRIDIYQFITTGGRSGSRSGGRSGSGTTTSRRLLTNRAGPAPKIEVGEIEVWGYYPKGVTNVVYKVVLPEVISSGGGRTTGGGDRNGGSRG